MAQFNKHDLRDKAAVDSQLSATDFRVLHLLLMHRNEKTRKCFPAAQTLAREAGLKERALRDSLSRLRSAGYVNWLKGSPGRANAYWFPQLGDKEILSKRERQHRQKNACDKTSTPAGNCRFENDHTGSFTPQHRQISAVHTGRKLPTNTVMEHENEHGTVRPSGELVPDTHEQDVSMDVAEANSFERSIDDHLIQFGIDDLDMAHALDARARTEKQEN